ncbi:transcriptional regulator, LysR family [Cupriavidus sp. OV038]|uniref:LysR family transcriptional regulator n=1 Tax=unclassified Cupriavidus TaxID=2640874 RepID=UPI0008EB095C|nr:MULTISPECIES: LysR family transcriptional regulator [unclassified Cupriavidus]SFC20440.1 transcriptional regulator, LysR family [Cupriavidus sp. OV038]SFP15001.1 transcriptional regulator, LysR family [Cupriavidus sp. OV096]
MDVRFLQSFVTVVDVGSLAEAARRLDLTPAAIAARLHALEEEIGVPLVRRAGRSVVPTEAGIRILERARQVIRDVRDMSTVASGDASLGEFRLGSFVTAMGSIVPPLLGQLYRRHPDVNLFVKPGRSIELCESLVRGELDAAIVVEPQFAVAKGYQWAEFIAEPLVVVAPAALAGQDPHVLLATQPFIRYDRSVLGGQLADRYLRDHDIRPHQRLEVDGLMVIAALVSEGLGVALVPDWAPMWDGPLKIARLPLPDRAPVRRVGLIWATHGPRASLAEALLDEARALFRTTRT